MPNKKKKHIPFSPEKYPCIGIKQTIFQGSGSISKIPEIIESEGWTRILLVIDPGVRKVSGETFEELLAESGVEYAVFDKIEPNPLEEDIEKVGLTMYQEFGAQAMVAVGGGSAMDSAKGISMMGNSGKNVVEAEAYLRENGATVMPPWEVYPIIAVPTTCGSGSEATRNAVITEPNGHKLVPHHDCLFPKYAVCDPDLLATLPPRVAAATAMDSLVQAIESYVSLGSFDFSEICALRAIELMGPSVVAYVHNPAITEYADKISKGCLYAGFSWNLASLAQIHATNHPITELLHIPHGEACAILLPSFVEWNGVVCREKFWKVHNLMYPDAQVTLAEFSIPDFVRKLVQLNRDLGILGGKTLADYGCDEAMIDKFLEHYRNLAVYPRKTTKEEMKAIYMDILAANKS